ncbi:MAG: TlpA family protein disulfide reductase [Lewinellaceae bacterium]|nr:TlpA family protein disulfide reductase [Lewinellaceae bacterium]
MTSKQTQWGLGILAFVMFAWYQYRKPNFSAGEPLPVFSALSMNGDSIRSTDFRGKYVLVQFWGSWCGPCRAENPQLVGLYQKFQPKGFDILSIGIETNEARWKNAIERDGMIWPNHTADFKRFDGQLATLFNVKSIPSTFLVNPQGNIIAVNAQPAEIQQILSQNLGVH